MIVNIIIDGEEYSVAGDYQPAEGDGWNDPRYPESFEPYEVRDAYGKEITNWQDYWTDAYIEEEVLSELRHQEWATLEDDPYEE